MAFIALLVIALVAVVLSGRWAYHKGVLLETAKANAEALVRWAEAVASENDKDGPLPIALCASSPAKAAGPAVPAPVPGKAATWSSCREALLSPGGPLADLVNPFDRFNLVTGSKCERKTPLSRGLVVLEKGTAAPPGMPAGMTWTGLADDEPLVRGLVLRVQVCDEGGYPLRIAELKL